MRGGRQRGRKRRGKIKRNKYRERVERKQIRKRSVYIQGSRHILESGGAREDTGGFSNHAH